MTGKHDQIAGSLIQDILSGRYRVSERLPSERDLATRFDANRGAVREAMNGVFVEMGSAGAKVASVIQGHSDVYLHAGGQYEWDSAAPVAVARAAGLHTSRIDGTSLAYNQRDPRLPDLIVCRPEYAAAVLAVTAEDPG